MRKSTRLFELIQILRAARRPVTADELAERLGVSARTVYRDIAALQASLAAESNARQSADTSNSNAIVAETNARVAADGDLSNDIAAEASIARAAEQVNSQAITQEISDRVSAVAAESARAQAAEAALGVRIDNVLSNVDPAAQDSLAELLAAYTAADSSLGDSITAALARISTLEAQVAALTDAP